MAAMATTSASRPLVNSWTEWGRLEYICVGSVQNMCYPDEDPYYWYNVVQDKKQAKYLSALGPRPKDRIKKATEELQNLSDLLEAETVKVATVKELEQDIEQDLIRRRSYLVEVPANANEDGRVKQVNKSAVSVCRAPSDCEFDHLLMTPWFKNYYQFGLACPRDMVITFGNTILEAATASRVRYFESSYYRPMIDQMWNKDRRIHWKKAPQPTCSNDMFELDYWKQDDDTIEHRILSEKWRCGLSEKEPAFDAADMMRFGRDIFYKKGCSANNKGIEWLRREFPYLRFHMMHFPHDPSPHIDVNLLPVRAPKKGSSGTVLINRGKPPTAADMQLFHDNDWDVRWCPKPVTDETGPVAICSSSLSMNFLSLSDKVVVIEECEVPLYHFLEDLGFDVITVPLRSLNEFGGGVHCVTWDIKRDEDCGDFFPNQDYEAELKRDLNEYSETQIYTRGLVA